MPWGSGECRQGESDEHGTVTAGLLSSFLFVCGQHVVSIYHIIWCVTHSPLFLLILLLWQIRRGHGRVLRVPARGEGASQALVASGLRAALSALCCRITFTLLFLPFRSSSLRTMWNLRTRTLSCPTCACAARETMRLGCGKRAWVYCSRDVGVNAVECTARETTRLDCGKRALKDDSTGLGQTLFRTPHLLHLLHTSCVCISFVL